MADAALVVFMLVTIVLLFVAMVLSAMASVDADKKHMCKVSCKKYATWSALVTGIAVAIITIVMIVYIYSTRKHKKA